MTLAEGRRSAADTTTYWDTGSSTTTEKKWPTAKPKQQRWSGWQGTIMAGILATTVSLVANLALFVLGIVHYDPIRGRGNISSGSCESTPMLDMALHIGVNLLSAFLITSSNSAMQCLSAPSRADVDASHAKGESVEIAISGIRNLRFMPTLRRSLWWMLLLTSIPLHLFYNAVIMTTMTAYSWEGLLVNNNFLQGDVWNSTLFGNASTPLDGLATTLQQEAMDGSLHYMDSNDCQQVFEDKVLFNYQAVLFITNLTSYPLKNTSQPVLGYMSTNDGLRTFTNLSDPNSPLTLTTQDSPDLGRFWTDLAANNVSLVDHCLVELAEQLCTVDTIPVVQAIVVFLNLVKLCCFLIILYDKRDQPLITIGDAVASFLQYPDETTRYQSHKSSLTMEPNSGEFLEKAAKPIRGRFWFRAPSRLQWLLTSIICVGYWTAGLVILVMYVRSKWMTPGPNNQWITDGFHKFDLSHIFLGGGSDIGVIDLPATIKSVVVINSFQLLLSTAYFHFNGIITTMLLSREFTNYARCRKGLRVSNPRGEQRLAYWLSIPYTYAVPIAIVSTALHFFLSEAFYYQEAIVIDRVDGTPDVLPRAVISAEALFIVLILCACCILGLVVLGCQRYAGGIPLVRFDSRAISASCHPRRGYPCEAHRKLMWGVRGYDGGKPDIGFSSDAVQPLDSTASHPSSFGKFMKFPGIRVRRQAAPIERSSTTNTDVSASSRTPLNQRPSSIGSKSSHVWMQGRPAPDAIGQTHGAGGTGETATV